MHTGSLYPLSLSLTHTLNVSLAIVDEIGRSCIDNCTYIYLLCALWCVMPRAVNSMAESVLHFMDHFPLETMSEGDVYTTNDPWMATVCHSFQQQLLVGLRTLHFINTSSDWTHTP